MKIAVAGTGYVGLVVGACLADFGHDVCCVDIDVERIGLLKRGRAPYYEPGLEELLERGIRSGHLSFDTDLREASVSASAVFVTVGTPSRPDGSADLGGVLNVAESVGHAADGHGPKVLAIKSTVPVGTCDQVDDLLQQMGAHSIAVVSNPEFLREGRAIADFLRPDRVVIGTEDPYARQLMCGLYSHFVPQERILVMDRHSAEMAKYASNAFLATRISFINEIAGLCEAVGADVESVRKAIGMDPRIGSRYLSPGIGYGGSCLPKDVRALIHTARRYGAPMQLVEAVQGVNAQQPLRAMQRIREHFDGDLEGRRIAVWGLAFKPETDDVRESPSLELIRLLVEAGASVTAYDPQACDAARPLLPAPVALSCDQYEALRDADALVVATEWDAFRAPDFARMRALMKAQIILDGRNIYDPCVLHEHGFRHYSIGRAAGSDAAIHATEAPASARAAD